jgi:HK97 gp10 family phage protein
MKFYVDPQSFAKLQRKLEKEFPREASKEGRAVLKKAVTELRNKVRSAAPVDEGVLRRSIYVKVLRDKLGEPSAADVRVRTGGKAQKKNRDGFYWRFIEYGTKKMPARPFVAPTLEKFKPHLIELFKEYRDGLGDKFNRD